MSVPNWLSNSSSARPVVDLPATAAAGAVAKLPGQARESSYAKSRTYYAIDELYLFLKQCIQEEIAVDSSQKLISLLRRLDEAGFDGWEDFDRIAESLRSKAYLQAQCIAEALLDRDGLSGQALLDCVMSVFPQPERMKKPMDLSAFSPAQEDLQDVLL